MTNETQIRCAKRNRSNCRKSNADVERLWDIPYSLQMTTIKTSVMFVKGIHRRVEINEVNDNLFLQDGKLYRMSLATQRIIIIIRNNTGK